ncbi:MAG TPA: hypothetical protein VFM88_23190 [Vicinamibacteria bacterium]|nr:hypothetical protein [Vicinamibacteria bacterium]
MGGRLAAAGARVRHAIEAWVLATYALEHLERHEEMIAACDEVLRRDRGNHPRVYQYLETRLRRAVALSALGSTEFAYHVYFEAFSKDCDHLRGGFRPSLVTEALARFEEARDAWTAVFGEAPPGSR